MTQEQKNELLYKPNCIRTRSGKHLNLLDPQPEQIDISDIAYGLSNIPRFAGQPMTVRTVAQHVISCAANVEEGFELEALLHDATEAYIGDMPSPLKKLCPDYKIVEKRLHSVIAKKFGIPEEMSPEVKAVDLLMLEMEFEKYYFEECDPITPADREYQREIFLLSFELCKHQGKN
ncbi:putative hydrolase [Cellulophaga phage phi46:1]|uniref:deoxyribonucleoside 5' monophosphate phosphatase n=1 Tax=Cellulophaga phage phi46:1 TaxID=1327974 RepID=UPI000351682A|nr:deoxyribonucleoside 5' monophosphate phosphatase [Cellulophaga phage phi46:1]AGO47839.1 putative hydrolase [Cellulophaga phage phi46:1]